MTEMKPDRENKKGSLFVVGLGPGDEDMISPKVEKVISIATDIVGYGPVSYTHLTLPTNREV